MKILHTEQNIGWAAQPNQLQEILDDVIPPPELVSAVFAYVFDGNRVLLTKNHRGWEVPGGHVEPGEHPDEAVVREVKEETGADIEVEKPYGYRRLEVFGPKPENDPHPYPISYLVFYLGRLIALNDFKPEFESTERALVEIDQIGKYFQRKHFHFDEALRLYRLNNTP